MHLYLRHLKNARTSDPGGKSNASASAENAGCSYPFCSLHFFALILLFPLALSAQKPPELSPAAPADRPVPAIEECQLRHLTRAIKPYVDTARATFPGALARYLKGLPSEHTFFVSVQLTDETKRVEQVFLVVDSIRGDRVIGRIRSQVQLVRKYRYGQPYGVPAKEIMDWLIAKPDGSEEGNFVGRFLDTYQPPAVCSSA